MSKKVSAGDLIAIPAYSGKCVLGKTLFVSKYYKNVVLLRLWSVDVHKIGVEVDKRPTNSFLFFTTQGEIKDGEWEIIGNEKLNAEEPEMLRYYSAGSIYLGHERIGSVTNDDRRCLLKLSVKGYGLVQEEAATILRDNASEFGFPV